MTGSAAEAILFFDGHDIAREMTYAEFQAVLDSYIALDDIRSRTIKAVYIRINHHFQPTAMVFFLLPFDKEGYVEKNWNVPLCQLADQTAKGPDMGAGPIRLACYSQCPVEWHQKSLWDPIMEATCNDFLVIKKAIKNNRLGLVFTEDHELSNHAQLDNSDSDSHDDERTRAAILIKEQRLKYKLAVNKSQQDMRQLSLDHQHRILEYQQQLQELQYKLNLQDAENENIKEQLITQQDKLSGMREYYENKLVQVRRDDDEEFSEIKERYETEVMMRVETTLAEMQSELDARKVELLYRNEREAKLQEEILHLQQENNRLHQSLQSEDNFEVLNQLQDVGVNFVTYHPGLGHISIPPDDVSSYLSNTSAYVAHCCGVNEHLYRVWLDHYYSPLCQHEHTGGEQCEKPLDRIEDPSQFIVGESDRCAEHRTCVPSVVNINKNSRSASLYSSGK